MSRLKDIRKLTPLNKAVKQAALDMYEDLGKVEARYTAWAVRGVKKLTRETLKSGKRYAVLNINTSLNSAVLPLDFEEAIFVGFINKCGKKVAINIDPRIVNHQLIDEIPCDNQCNAQCDCYPKQLCSDLSSIQEMNPILINDTYYDQTITRTLLPSGEYYEVITTPVMNTVSSGIDYKTTKRYVTAFDVEECGCIKKTERNKAKLEHLCWDQYCCYCTGCEMTNTPFGGYQIFTENNTIHFSGDVYSDKCYMEYRGGLPKEGNEYLIPEVAFETLVNFIKFKSVENKKGISLGEKDWVRNLYIVERSNMTKVLGRLSIADILHSAMLVPSFAYDANHCPIDYTHIPDDPLQYTYNDTSVPVTPNEPPMPPICKPIPITVEGSEMTDGQTYNNPALAGLNLRIMANPLNRMLLPSEYTVLPTGGFTTSLGPFGFGDYFDIFPKYC